MSWPARLGTIAQSTAKTKVYAMGTSFYGDKGDNISGIALTPTRLTTGGANNMRFVSASLTNPLYGWGEGASVVISSSGQMGLMGVLASQVSCAQVNQILWYDGVTNCVFTGSIWKHASLGPRSGTYITKTGVAWIANSTSATYLRPVTKINNDTNWKESITGNSTSGTDSQRLFIKTTGTLWGFGYTTDGWLGTGSATLTYVSPVRQIGSATDWSTLRTGNQHVLALKTGGSIWSWGNNIYGQVGNNTVVNRSSPVQIGALTTWTKIASGDYHSIAVKSDGTLWAWGYNNKGQLGQGNTTNRSSPVQVGALTTWANVFASGNRSYGIKTDGTLWSWGENFTNYFEFNAGVAGLGLGDSTDRNSPVQVGTATDWGNAVIAGDYWGAMKGIKSDGSLWVWGSNYLMNTTLEPSPSNNLSFNLVSADNWTSARAVKAIQLYQARGSGVLARRSDGTLWRWGGSGTAFGAGEYTNDPVHWRSSPVQVTTGSKWTDEYDVGPQNRSIAIDSNGKLWKLTSAASLLRTGSWSKVAIGYDSGVPTTIYNLCLTSTGQLFASGVNNFGNLGNNSTAFVNLDTLIRVGTSTWSQVAAAYFSSYGIRTDGTLWAWGYNNKGQLGLGDVVNRSSPVQVGTGNTWAKVFACPVSQDVVGGAAFAIKTDGTLWSWGYNQSGILGHSSGADRSSPVQVGTGTNWSRVDGISNVFALKTDGTLWSWGRFSQTYNLYSRPQYGSVGNGTTSFLYSPVQTGYGYNTWTFVSSGNSVALAVGT